MRRIPTPLVCIALFGATSCFAGPLVGDSALSSYHYSDVTGMSGAGLDEVAALDSLLRKGDTTFQVLRPVRRTLGGFFEAGGAHDANLFMMGLVGGYSNRRMVVLDGPPSQVRTNCPELRRASWLVSERSTEFFPTKLAKLAPMAPIPFVSGSDTTAGCSYSIRWSESLGAVWKRGTDKREVGWFCGRLVAYAGKTDTIGKVLADSLSNWSRDGDEWSPRLQARDSAGFLYASLQVREANFEFNRRLPTGGTACMKGCLGGSYALSLTGYKARVASALRPSRAVASAFPMRAFSVTGAPVGIRHAGIVLEVGDDGGLHKGVRFR